MTLNLDSYNTASTVMHSAQGAALLALGFTEAYAWYKPGGRIRFISPLALMLSGAGMLLAMLYFLGGWSVESLMFSLQLKSGFYIFVSFACFYASAGLSQLTFLSSDEKSRGWHYLFLFFLAVIGLLYFGMSKKVNPEAAVAVAAAHSAFGFTLLTAVIFKLLNGFRPRKGFSLAWVALILIASFQLLSYREVEGAFDFRVAGVQASPQTSSPAAVAGAVKSRTISLGKSIVVNKNAKITHPKRAGN